MELQNLQRICSSSSSSSNSKIHPALLTSPSPSPCLQSVYVRKKGMSCKGGGSASSLPKDVSWRASNIKPIPKIHHSPLLRIAPNPTSNYALSVTKHPNPVGSGLAMEAIVESAGPDCIVPGQVAPVKLLGLKVWPIEVNFKFLEPVGRVLKQLGKFMDDAVNLMNKSFIDR